jgi:phytol kinase
MVPVLGPVFAAYALGAGAWVGRLKVVGGVRTPYTRKIFHFLIFTAAGVIQVLWGLPAVSLFGMVVTVAVLIAVRRGDGFSFYEALARETDAPHRTLFILVPLATTALGGIAGNLLFAGHAFVGYLVCGWGDAVGEPAGTRWGRHRYTVPSLAGVPATRSWEGSACVFAAGTAAAAAGLLFAGRAPLEALPAALACGLAGAAVEAVSLHGTDNLTVQLAASAAAYLVLGPVPR